MCYELENSDGREFGDPRSGRDDPDTRQKGEREMRRDRGCGRCWAIRLVRSAVAVVAWVSVGLSPSLAADPGLDQVGDVLRGKRVLLTTDDLVVVDSAWSSTYSTTQKEALLYTANGSVTSEASVTVRAATCGVDAAASGANKPFPQQVQTARMLDRAHDVVVSIIASNNAFGDGCQGDSNLQVKVMDTTSNELVASAFYSMANLDYLVSVVDDFDRDGLDDVLVMNGDKAFVVSAPSAGSTIPRSGPSVSTGAARTPMGEPVVGDFNADGLSDVAWPAATVSSGSPQGSATKVHFATVCPGSVSGTVCSGRSRFEIVLDPLSSQTIQLQSTPIVFESQIPCSATTSGTTSTTVYPLMALAAGDFTGSDRDSLFVVYSTVSYQDCAQNTGLRAATYSFDSAMRPTPMTTKNLGGTGFGIIQGLYAKAARLNWFGGQDQVVIAFGGATLGFDNSFYQFSETHVSVITFDGSLGMTTHDTKRTLTSRSDTVALLRGLAVGRFADLPSNATSADFNPQIAVLMIPTDASHACTSGGTHTSYLDVYTLDATAANYTPSLAHTYRPCLGYNPTTTAFAAGQILYSFQGWNTGGSLLRSGDLQGRSVRVGQPLILRESSHSQPLLILGAPPSHVDYVQPAGSSSTRPAIINFSALPPTYTASFALESQTSSQGSNTQTTSYSHAKAVTEGGGLKLLDIPVAGSVLGTTSQTTTNTYESDVADEYDTYSSTTFDISASTEASDNVWFNSTSFNAYYYPVLGQTVCAGDTTSCASSDRVPLLAAFSGPGETRMLSIAGELLEWYQPIEEPLQVFSYPWSEQQLLQRIPQAEVLSQPLAFFTDSVDVSESVQWSSGQGQGTTASSTSTHSVDSSRSITAGSPDLTQQEGSGGQFVDALAYSSSTSMSTLNTNVTITGASAGVTIEKPGTFASPAQYAYMVAPYILGQDVSQGTLQDIPTDTDVSTSGTLQVAYVADPTDGNAGSWWRSSPYAQHFDVALNHPVRWDMVATSPSSSQGAECLLVETNGFAVSCARLNEPDSGDLWNSEFYWMRGLLVTVGGTGGPQRTQAQAGERVYLTARVYNYSLKAMPSDSRVRVRFYRQPWDTSTGEPDGDSVLIAENSLDPIPPFNSTTNPTVANWVLTSASFDTTDLGGSSMIFWVVVWAEDANGNLLSELVGHGLASKPGTLRSIADVPLESSSYVYQLLPRTTSFSNNAGFLRLPFFVEPATSNRASAQRAQRNSAGGGLRVERLHSVPLVAPYGEKVSLRARVHSNGDQREGVTVIFYEGDPDHGGRAIDVEMLGRVSSDRPHHVRVPYRSRTCGAHEVVVVVDRGLDEEARDTIDVVTDCSSPLPTPTTTPTVSATASPTGPASASGGDGCAITAVQGNATPSPWVAFWCLGILIVVRRSPC